jgi:hypothetical protein
MVEVTDAFLFQVAKSIYILPTSTQLGHHTKEARSHSATSAEKYQGLFCASSLTFERKDLRFVSRRDFQDSAIFFAKFLPKHI